MRRARTIVVAALVAATPWVAVSQALTGPGSSADTAATAALAQADSAFTAARWREAIAGYERALQLGADQPGLGAWQIARAYALEGNRKQALRWLGHAVGLGFDDREAIRREPAFEPYRDDPRFIAVAEGPSGESGAWRRSPPRLPASQTGASPSWTAARR